METTTHKQYLVGAGAVLAVLLSVYVLVLSVKEWKSVKYIGGENSQGYITVSGVGEAVSVPDIATFSYSVDSVAKTVNQARDEATVITNKALAVLKASGIADADVKTTAYSIAPKYEYTYTQTYGQKQNFVGYEVSQTIEVKVHDLNKVGQLFTDVSATGVKNLGNIAFSIENKDTLKQQARDEAIAKAKQQAKELARSLGVSLVRISNFQESNNSPYPVAYYAKGGMMTDAAVAPAPSIPAGEEKIVSNVSITYEIR